MPRHSTKDPNDRQERDGLEEAPTGLAGLTPSPDLHLRLPSSRLPTTLLALLNALPTTGSAVEWAGAFSQILCSVFNDVDCVVVRANLHCRLASPLTAAAEELRIPTALLSGALVAQIEELGSAPLEIEVPTCNPAEYQPPMVYRYTHAGDHLGAISLLRELGHDPISPESLMMMSELEPFLVFALTDLVARYSYAKPIGRVFYNVLRAIASDRRLTNRELQVLTLHMFGRKYDEISRRLFISIDTVKKHVKKIHRKTNARSATELFARYFTPLIDRDETP